jgi:hypothetical protein
MAEYGLVSMAYFKNESLSTLMSRDAVSAISQKM